MTTRDAETIRIDGKNLEYQRYSPALTQPHTPTIVMLHEGLGSISMWRDFPQQLADATQCETLAYSRAGYGYSDPVPPYTPHYMHHEGLVVLPELLSALKIERPVLFGHSDGGSIALLCAGSTPTPLAGIIVLAPHVMVEDMQIDGITAAGNNYRNNARFRAGLGKYHADGDSVFRHWHEIWLDPAFRAWNIEACLPKITCPVLGIQGTNDEYGTMTHLERIAAQVAGEATMIELAHCGHIPHKDQPQAVLDASAHFIDHIRDKRC